MSTGGICFSSKALADDRRSVSPVEDRADDLLEDGYNALQSHRPDLAQKIFETIAAAYPHSQAARSAAAELARLGDAAKSAPGTTRGPDIPSPEFTLAARTEQLRKLRMRFLMDIGDRVFFAENSASIGGRARAVLEAQARWLKQAKNVEVTIIGRADDGGSGAQAEGLARDRAKAVEAVLLGNGVPAAAIRIDSRGSADPIATCKEAICQAQNRHAETQLRLTGDPIAAIANSRSRHEGATRGAEASPDGIRPMPR